MDAKECPGCAIEVDTAEKACPICGYEFPQQTKALQIMVWVMIALMAFWLIM